MEATELIAACRKLGDARAADSVADALDGAVEALSTRFAVSLPPGWRVTAGHTVDGTTSERYDELVQHLTDLAYLTPSRYKSWHRAREAARFPSPSLWREVAAAVAVFLREDHAESFRLIPAYPEASVDRLAWLSRYLMPLLARCRLYTSFDGDLHPRASYRIGEASAFGRSLAFRLRVYFQAYGGTHSARRKLYFDHKLIPLLYSLNNSLSDRYAAYMPTRGAREQLSTQVQQLLLSSTLLFNAYRRANRFTPEARKPYFLVYRTKEAATSRRGSKRASKKLASEQRHADTGANHLGIRLLQLGLWRAGFYTGVLDGTFGARSHEAVLALVDQEAEAEAGQRPLRPAQLRRLVSPVGEDRREWVVDLRLLGKLLSAYAPPDRREVLREEERLLKELGTESGERALDEVYRRRKNEYDKTVGGRAAHPNRRTYYGLRGLIRGTVRAIGKAIGWLLRGIGQLIGAAFELMKYLVQRIQTGVNLLFAGFQFVYHFLLGRPFVTLGNRLPDNSYPVLSTAFRLDMDTVSLVHTQASGEDVRSHLHRLKELLDGAAFLVEAATAAIALIKSLGSPTGWLRLTVLVGRYVYGRLLSTAAGGDEQFQEVA